MSVGLFLFCIQVIWFWQGPEKTQKVWSWLLGTRRTAYASGPWARLPLQTHTFSGVEDTLNLPHLTRGFQETWLPPYALSRPASPTGTRHLGVGPHCLPLELSAASLWDGFGVYQGLFVLVHQSISRALLGSRGHLWSLSSHTGLTLPIVAASMLLMKSKTKTDGPDMGQ